MKIIKMICNLFLSIVLIVCCLVVPTRTVEAKTLGDLKKELDARLAEYQKTQNDKKLTEQQIKDTKNNITSITNEIAANQQTIVELNEEIEALNISIEQHEQEIREVIKFYQLSEGESSYLEYAFGAADFTDFIYRLAISEQLANYNQELVAKQNKMIEDNKQAQKDLANKEKELMARQEKLNSQLDSLGNKLSEVIDITMDIEEEIKLQREAIEMYEKQYNCKDSDEISKCTANKLPADTAFWRPLVTGHRSSEYGYRTYTLNGKTVTDFHSGIDITTSPNDNVPVYAAAAGRVVGIVSKSSCGGNKIFINHYINGKKYTTGYNHLRKILVSVGDVVTKDTQIAVMGGNPRIETWDSCSTGAHLHLSIATGWYLDPSSDGYMSYNTFIAKTVNPRTLVNFPSGGGTFYNRTTKY